MRLAIFTFISALATFALLACDSGGGGGGGGGGCLPGAQLPCSCSDGSPGARTCNALGTAYEACVCGFPGDGGNLPDASDDGLTTDPGPDNTPDDPIDTDSCEFLGWQCGTAPSGDACGQCPDGQTCNASHACAATPGECATLGYDCGSTPGGQYCGDCPTGQSCTESHACEATPNECVELGYDCGMSPGGQYCGECQPGYACGVDHKCAFTDECAQLSLECGLSPSGQNCGQCPSGWTCETNTCKQQPNECGELGYECGSIPGGENCGNCPSGYSCTNHACVDECADLGWQCGTSPSGASCGVCQVGCECNAQHACECGGDAQIGMFCGWTADCPLEVPDPSSPGDTMINDNYVSCANAQCESGLCADTYWLTGYWPGFIPACSSPCTITKDQVNNATGASGADNVEDADVAFSDCANAVAGPAGSKWVCANFAPPGSAEESVCVPGTTLKACEGDSDCPTGEGCFFTTLGGEYGQRCFTKIQSGEWFDAKEVGEACSEDPFDPHYGYCASGPYCSGIGCRPFCKSDADCGGWTCGDPEPLFSDLPDYTPRLCWPGSCDTDADCPAGAYCRFFWNGDPYPDATWDNLCLTEIPGGADLGEPCDVNPDDDIPGATCKNEDYCFDGYCSQICTSDGDCATNLDQLCSTIEFPGDFDEDGEDDFSLALDICSHHEGYTNDCVTDADCPSGQACDFYEIPNPNSADKDAPYLLRGKCVDSAASQGGYGAECYASEDCDSGFCLQISASDTDPGICSKRCESASDCGTLTLGTETVTGRCDSLLLGWGGDIENSALNVYVGLCVINPPSSSGTDCSSTLTCGSGESCSFSWVAGDPTTAPHIDYQCQDWTNADGSAPTKSVGADCDPNAEDADGNYLGECMSGLCLETNDLASHPSGGYCSALCSPGTVDCTNPAQACDTYTIVQRQGAYAQNSVRFNLCRESSDCVPCYNTENCPFDQVCVNLGQDDATLADYRCVQPCVMGSCSDGKACNSSTDGMGTPTQGCFDKGSFPIDHCLN